MGIVYHPLNENKILINIINKFLISVNSDE